MTFYRSVAQLPPFSDYRMAGRTYRYFAGEPLYPFGYGLSYTRFAYRGLVVPDTVPNGQPVQVSVEVQNVGTRAGDEVVQLYVTDMEASVPVALRSLQGATRVSLEPGERRTVRFAIAPRQFSLVDASLARVVEPGVFEIAVGGRAPGPVGRADTTTTGLLTARVEITGATLRLQ